MTWSANGAQLHKYEIDLLLNNSNVDTLLLLKTHLIEGSKIIYFKNYHCYQGHHPSGCVRKGPSIIIKVAFAITYGCPGYFCCSRWVKI